MMKTRPLSLFVPTTKRFLHTNVGSTTDPSRRIRCNIIFNSKSTIGSGAVANLRGANSYFQRCQFASSSITTDESTTPSSSKLQTPSLAPSSLNILPSIPIALLQSIRQLPEVESAFAATGTTTTSLDEVVDNLDRASTIFTQFQLPNEHDAITSLQAQILHDGGRYTEAVGKMALLRERVAVGESSGDDSDGKEGDERRLRRLWNIIQLQAKSKWYEGSFDVAEGLAVEASDLAPHITDGDGSGGLVGLRQGCSMNALALSKLAALDIRDERVMGLYRDDDDDNNDDNNDDDQYWSKTLRESDEIKDLLGMASRVMSNDYHSMKQNNAHSTTNNNNTDTNNNDIDTHSTTVKLALASAALYCNQGVAELFFLTAKHRLMGEIVSTDPAMHTWREAINVLDDLDQFLDNDDDDDDDHQQKVRHHHRHGLALAKFIRARVYCNMAWSILYFHSSVIGINEPRDEGGMMKPVPIKEDQLKIASEYAGSALKLYEALSIDDLSSSLSVIKPSMGRALGLVASCYAKAGASVTAEGLFQSSIDNCIGSSGSSSSSSSNSPLTGLDARSCLLHYSDLCKNWENRGVDAKKNADRTLEMDRSLQRVDGDSNKDNNGNGWRGKSDIYSGLWFFSIGDF